jgi:proton-translocating NAD(P)+ transhydrogenase subunit alpha
MLQTLLVDIYVFVLAMFVGFEVITKVPTILHTPLMSGSNAISGISLVGAVIIAGRLGSPLGTIIGIVAVVFGTINVVGGFMVTDRMLQMFKRRAEPAAAGAGGAGAAPSSGSGSSGSGSGSSGNGRGAGSAEAGR